MVTGATCPRVQEGLVSYQKFRKLHQFPIVGRGSSHCPRGTDISVVREMSPGVARSISGVSSQWSDSATCMHTRFLAHFCSFHTIRKGAGKPGCCTYFDWDGCDRVESASDVPIMEIGPNVGGAAKTIGAEYARTDAVTYRNCTPRGRQGKIRHTEAVD